MAPPLSDLLNNVLNNVLNAALKRPTQKANS